jgi:hypothetical protein
VRKPFRHEELGEELVEVERCHEELRALVELGLRRLRLLLLGEDVDVEAGELGGQAHVLPAPPDGERSCSSGTTTSMRSASSSMTTLETSAGWSALTRKVGMSSFQGMMSIFSPAAR